MARFTPFTEAMEMRSAWCDTNERREWGGYAALSLSVYVALTYIPGGGLLTGFAMTFSLLGQKGEGGTALAACTSILYRVCYDLPQ